MDTIFKIVPCAAYSFLLAARHEKEFPMLQTESERIAYEHAKILKGLSSNAILLSSSKENSETVLMINQPVSRAKLGEILSTCEKKQKRKRKRRRPTNKEGV
jgi:hypothetical protein